MDRIQLMQLRDIAIEYLPAAQEVREHAKELKLRASAYNESLLAVARFSLCDPTSTVVELAAARLLSILETWGRFDPDSPELGDVDPQHMRDTATNQIFFAVKALIKVTGKMMPFHIDYARTQGKMAGSEIPVGIMRTLFPPAVPPATLAIPTQTETKASDVGWIDKSQEIAQKIGLTRYGMGMRQITARNICNETAEILANDTTTHGSQGPRSGSNVRNVGLRGWKFSPP